MDIKINKESGKVKISNLTGKEAFLLEKYHSSVCDYFSETIQPSEKELLTYLENLYTLDNILNPIPF